MDQEILKLLEKGVLEETDHSPGEFIVFNTLVECFEI